MSNRNLPPSFWNSNYIHPVVAPSHPQVNIPQFFPFFIALHLCNCSYYTLYNCERMLTLMIPRLYGLLSSTPSVRSPICTRRTAATRLIRGCRMPLTTVTLMRRMLTPPKRTPTTTIWRNTAVCCGYRNTTATVPGTCLCCKRKRASIWLWGGG